MDFLFLYKSQKVVFDFNCKYLMMLAEAVKAKVIVARAVYFILFLMTSPMRFCYLHCIGEDAHLQLLPNTLFLRQ